MAAEDTIKISNFPDATALDGTERFTGLDDGQNRNFTLSQLITYFLQQLPGVTFTSEEKTKLGGIAAGATVNQTDTFLTDRGNHTGTQAAATIADLADAVVAIMANTLQQGSNVTITHNEETGKITIAASGGGGSVTIDPTPVNGSSNAVSSGGVFTGLGNKQDKETGKGLSANDFTNILKAKLDGIATNATANQADSVVNGRLDTLDSNVGTAQTTANNAATAATAARSRSNHLGTQLAATISDFEAATHAIVDGVAPAFSTLVPFDMVGGFDVVHTLTQNETLTPKEAGKIRLGGGVYTITLNGFTLNLSAFVATADSKPLSNLQANQIHFMYVGGQFCYKNIYLT